jgi:hypothetical protein
VPSIQLAIFINNVLRIITKEKFTLNAGQELKELSKIFNRITIIMALVGSWVGRIYIKE